MLLEMVAPLGSQGVSGTSHRVSRSSARSGATELLLFSLSFQQRPSANALSQSEENSFCRRRLTTKQQRKTSKSAATKDMPPRPEETRAGLFVASSPRNLHNVVGSLLFSPSPLLLFSSSPLLLFSSGLLASTTTAGGPSVQCKKQPIIYPLFTLYTPFITIFTPMYTRHTCIYTIYTPNTSLNSSYTPYTLPCIRLKTTY